MQQKSASPETSDRRPRPRGERGARQRELGPEKPGGTGEHPGKKPERNVDREDDKAPETPTDEPEPIAIEDPPTDDRPRSPLTVHGTGT